MATIRNLTIELDRTLDMLKQDDDEVSRDKVLTQLRVLRAVIDDVIPKECRELAMKYAATVKVTSPTARPWRIGRPGAVVADEPVLEGPCGSDDRGYYGGYLVCESITPSNAALVVQAVNAHDNLMTLLRAITTAVNGSTPGSAADDMETIKQLARIGLEYGKARQ